MTPDHPDWHRVLVEWNSTETEYPSKRCVHELFEEQVTRMPDAVAMVYEDQQLTYRELNERANRLARLLIQRGVAIGSRVGICIDRSMDWIVSVLSILKSGAAYVPIDPNYPAARIAFMIDDAELHCLVTHSSLQSRFAIHESQIVCVDACPAMLEILDPMDLSLELSSESIAYIIYTSGSTGRPKGVVIPHRGIARLVFGQDYVTFGPDRTFIQLASPSFDACTFEVWGALLWGAKLIVPSVELPSFEQLGQMLKTYRVNTLWLTSSLFNAIIDQDPMALSEVDELLVGGEALSVPHIRRSQKALGPRVRLINGYGPTECTTFAACNRIPYPLDTSWTTIPIGRPISNTQAYVLDEEMRPVPVGVLGELYLGGGGLALGYWNREELTQERFVRNPFSSDLSSRLYRTGDRCRWLADGTLEYLGRFDGQIKLRGFRIEIGEIEAALQNHGDVQQAVAVLREDRPGDPRLVAYCTLTAESKVTGAMLLDSVADCLPSYMVPSSCVVLETLPRNANGKLDRGALPAPSYEGAEEGEAPASEIERQVAAMWEEVLGIDKVGRHDNFFRLGGNSLLAVKVLGRLNRHWRSQLTARDLFDAPTIAGVASRISELQHSQDASSEGEESWERSIQRVARTEPLPVSSAQERMWFLDQTLANRAAYNIPLLIRLSGNCNTQVLLASLQDVLQRHEALRTRYQLIDDTLYQNVDPELSIEIPIEHLSDLDAGQRAAYVMECTRVDASKPFDLAHDPLVRAKIFVLDPDLHQVFLNIHHIACDGWSIEVLLREWKHCYRKRSQGVGPELPIPSLQYADFAVCQRQTLTSRHLQKSLEYWCDQLREVEGRLEWPGRKTRTLASSERGELIRFVLDETLTQRIESFCESQGVTPNMALLAAHQILIALNAGQSEIVTGIPIACRTRSELEGIVGLFVNTLPIRSVVVGEDSLQDLVRQVRETVLGAIMHQDVPLDKIVAAVQPERAASATPLFQTMFVFQNAHQSRHRWSGIDVCIDSIPNGTAKFDLTLSLQENGGTLAGTSSMQPIFSRPMTHRE